MSIRFGELHDCFVMSGLVLGDLIESSPGKRLIIDHGNLAVAVALLDHADILSVRVLVMVLVQLAHMGTWSIHVSSRIN